MTRSELPAQDVRRGSTKPSGQDKGLTVKSLPGPVLETRSPPRPRRSLAAPSAGAGFAHSRVFPLLPTSRAARGKGGGGLLQLTGHAGARGRGGSPGHLLPRSRGRPARPHPSEQGPPAGRSPAPVLGLLLAGPAPGRRSATLRTRRWFQTAAPGLLLPRYPGRRAVLFSRSRQRAPPSRRETFTAFPLTLGREPPNRKLRGLGAPARSRLAASRGCACSAKARTEPG